MDIYTVFLIVLLAAGILGDGTPTVNYAGCKSTHTLGYGYKNIYHITESGDHQGNNEITLRFLVQAISDAHILLSPTASPSDLDPVYEIVIGAGRNTFSDIRRQTRAQSKARVYTKDYLSDTEYRGFWIRLSRAGLIEVGKAGDDVPFIFWLDPTPLLIRYFAFCAWGSTVGRWIYNCPNDNTSSEAVEPSITLTTIERLRQDLLTHYDPYSRPILNENDVTVIFLHLTCQHVKLDEKRSILSVLGEVTMLWQDQKLHWNQQEYDNISTLPILYHEAWQPELVLYNAVGHGTDILSDTPQLVTSLGLVTWRSPINMQARCSLDWSQWPKDQHTCELQLGFWAQHEVLQLELIGNGSLIEQQTGSEWDILALDADPTRLKTPWINTTSDFKDNKALTIRLTLRRRSGAHTAILVVPLLVVDTMTLLSFWVSPVNSNKILLSCLNLVIMSMFIVALGGVLPAPADHVPQLVLTYSHGMVAVAISLVISVTVTGLTRYTHVYPLPSMLCTLITAKSIQIMLFLPSVIKEESTCYAHLQEVTGECSDSTPVPDTKTQTNYWEIQQYWILLAIVIDRLACITYAIYLINVLFNHS